MSLKLMTTQWTESDIHGDADLKELIEYIENSDLFMTLQGRGYARMREIKEMVSLMYANQSNKLAAKRSK